MLLWAQRSWPISRWFPLLFISLPETFLWKKLKSPGLQITMWIIRLVYGRWQPEASLLTVVNSSQKEMPLRTSLRIWLRSRNPAPRMIIFCVSSVMTRMYANRLNSCVPERLSTSSALEKLSGSFRINWIHRISISSILNLTSANHKEYHIKNVETVIKGEVYILALS